MKKTIVSTIFIGFVAFATMAFLPALASASMITVPANAETIFGTFAVNTINAEIIALYDLNEQNATVAIQSVSNPPLAFTAAVISFLTGSNPSRTITWQTNGFTSKMGVNINLIEKISNSPAAYVLVRQIGKDVPNIGAFSWQPLAGETGTNLYIEVTCADASSTATACSVSAKPIQIQ